MQLPLCDLESEKSQLEEQLLRFAGMDVASAERQMKEVSIKLFAVSSCTICVYLYICIFAYRNNLTTLISCSSLAARKWNHAPKS